MLLFWPSNYTLAISPIDNIYWWIDQKFYSNSILTRIATAYFRTDYGAIDGKMDGFVLLGLTFSSRLDLSSYIITIAKTASKKIIVLIRSMKFLSPEVTLYLYKSITWPCMEYCCCLGLCFSCYLELLDNSSKRGYVGLLLLEDM